MRIWWTGYTWLLSFLSILSVNTSRRRRRQSVLRVALPRDSIGLYSGRAGEIFIKPFEYSFQTNKKEKLSKKKKMTFKIFSGDKHDMKHRIKIKTKQLSGRIFGSNHQKLDTETRQKMQESWVEERTGKVSYKMSCPLIPLDFNDTEQSSRTSSKFFRLYISPVI